MAKAVVLTTLLYGVASWVINRRHLRLIERYHQRCLRTILNIHWSDFVTNIEVLDMAMGTSIEAKLLKIQFRWAGHVSKMEDRRLPKRHTVWGIVHWPWQQTGSTGKIQRHFEKVAR